MSEQIESEEPSVEKNDSAALGYGIAALVLGLIPLAFLLAAFDEGPRGRWSFADMKNWVGLSRFAIGSVFALVPTLFLAKRSRERAKSTFTALPAALALMAAMLMIPGAVIQMIWWIGG